MRDLGQWPREQEARRLLAGRPAAAVALAAALVGCGSSSDSSGLFGSGPTTSMGAIHDTGGAGGSGAGTSTGGQGGALAAVDAGGVAGSGGQGGGTASGDAAPQCSRSEKLCSGLCVFANPSVGCDGPSCVPCASPPANGVAVCVAGACDIVCDGGFTRMGDACTSGGGGASSGGAPGAGGATGAGGTTGTGGAIGSITTCPATAPSTGDICVNLNLACHYGTTTCSCLAAATLPIWYCR